MISVKVPVTIDQLLTSVGQATANIAKHRDAMAQVSAQVKANAAQQPQAGGETK
jgi:hypothetical protein